jgi:hypothetical protein
MSAPRIRTRTAAAIVAVLAIALGIGVAVLGRASTSPQTARTAATGTAANGIGTPGPAPLTSVTAAPPSAASLLAPTADAKYVGVALPNAAEGLATFTAAAGTSPDLNEVFADLGRPFPTALADKALSQGAYTLVSWMSEGQSPARIASGADDAQLRAFAAGAAAFGWPVLLDFDHEFNGNWYPWGTQAATPGQFVAAWRHIHAVFAAAGASNVLWVWSPNVVNPVPDVSLAAYWPGSQYVDVIGIVGYFTGQLQEDSYADLFGRTEHVVDAFADKPFLITEAGAAQGPDKPGWITDLIAGVRADPRMLGFVYFNEGTAQGKRDDWRLEDDPAAVSAWRAATAGLTIVPLPGEAG